MARIDIGIIGLGRMGSAIASRLNHAGHAVIGFDPAQTNYAELCAEGIACIPNLRSFPPAVRVFWLMVPAGSAVDDAIAALDPSLKSGDIVIDGGNSWYHDSIRRSAQLHKRGIFFIDCGVSGGLQGKEQGYALMIGGDHDIFMRLEPVWQALAAPDGYGYMGKSGMGHYVKMIHNGIEYALLQSYAEGLHILYAGKPELDLALVTRVWQNGSIIRSWIGSLLEQVLQQHPHFEHISGRIGENKTGQWTHDEAIKLGVPDPMITTALERRAWSRETGGDISTKIVALLRHAFGGHPLNPKG